MACVTAVCAPLFCDMNILWSTEIMRLLRGTPPDTSPSLSTESASTNQPPRWLYWSATCYVLVELTRCALVHRRLSKCLRRGYDNDGENCPQVDSLHTPSTSDPLHPPNLEPGDSALPMHTPESSRKVQPLPRAHLNPSPCRVGRGPLPLCRRGTM